MVDPTTIPILQDGEFITQDHYAKVTDCVRRFDPPSRGNNDSDGMLHQRPIVYRNPNRILVQSTVNVPRWSILTIVGQIGSAVVAGRPQTLYDVAAITVNSATGFYFGLALGYVVTGDTNLVAGVPSFATLVKPYTPFKVSGVSTGGKIPNFGQFVGVNGYQATLDSPRDILCTANDISVASSSTYLAECMWMQGITLEGQADGNIAAPSDGWHFPTTGTFKLYGPDSDSVATPIEFIDQGQKEFTVVNRDKTLVIPDKTYGHIRFINNEWRGTWEAC